MILNHQELVFPQNWLRYFVQEKFRGLWITEYLESLNAVTLVSFLSLVAFQRAESLIQLKNDAP